MQPDTAVRMMTRLLLLASSLLLAACAPGTGDEAEDAGPVVLAASSLQEGLTQAAAAWQAQGHAAPRLSFAASSALARQVEGGAPADLFLSADEEWMDHLETAGLLRPGTRTTLLTGDLVVVAPAGSTVTGIAALRSGRVALGDPAAVPAGRYARAALESLGQWADLAPRVVPAENVRAALALVERGEVDSGIVYATDALASSKVMVVWRFPASSHPPIRYPAAVLASSTSADAAGFLAFLSGQEARRIFTAHGFGVAAR